MMTRPVRIGLIGGVGLILMSPLACCVVAGWIERVLVPDKFLEAVTDSEGGFTRSTGLSWPKSARIIRTGDDHGGFHGDGEFYLVFDTDQETIERWLSGRAPWGAEKWRNGPVPSEIAGHCAFGEGMRRSGEVAQAFDKKSVVFVAKPRGPGGTPWHNGDLMVVDRVGNRVWVSHWDF